MPEWWPAVVFGWPAVVVSLVYASVKPGVSFGEKVREKLTFIREVT